MLTLRMPGGGSPPSPRTRSTTRSRRGIARVLAHIEINYSRAICLAELAALAEIHPSHLCREFKKHVGCSPLEYLKRFRIQRAAVLLRESNKSIKEVGFFVGFKRPEAFSKAFKKVIGCSPRHFRAASNNKESHQAAKSRFPT